VYRLDFGKLLEIANPFRTGEIRAGENVTQ
jgi:hypothetical protein